MKRSKKVYNLGDTWICECKKEHKLDGGYVAAHWDIELIHTCTCGLKHSIKSGKINLLLEIDADERN